MKQRIKKPTSEMEVALALGKHPNWRLAGMLAKKLYLNGWLATVKNLDYTVTIYYWNGLEVIYWTTTSRHKANAIFSAFKKWKLKGDYNPKIRDYIYDTTKKSLDYFIS